MKLSDLEQFEAHNRLQREYYSQPSRKTRMLPTASNYNRRQVNELISFGNLSTKDRLLEIGCGMGRHTFLLADLGFGIEGLDLSPVLLEKFREFDGGRYNIPTYCMDLLERPPQLKERFDSLIGFFMLHHLHDLNTSFAAMQYYLRPGGRLVFIEPNPFCPLYYAQIASSPGMTWEAEKGLWNMTLGKLGTATRQAGFVNLKLKRFGLFPPFLSNTSFGPHLERMIERIRWLDLVFAFQLIGAQAPA